MEEDIDLRVCVKALLRHWLWIGGVTILAAVAVFLYATFSPKSYQATAVVAVANPAFVIQFETTIANSPAPTTNPKAYVGLATADEVLAQLGVDTALAGLKPEERTLEALRLRLAASVVADSSLIRLSATDSDSTRAAAIVNAWAGFFVKSVNSVYRSAQDNQTFFDSQVSQAQGEYDAAQTALEAFLGNNRLDELQRQIDIRRTLIAQYQGSQIASRGLSLNLQMQNRRQLLTDDYADLISIERNLADARALREQVRQDASAAANTGNALALLLLRSKVFGNAGGSAATNTPQGGVQLQLALPQPLDPVSVADVDNLVAVLEQRQTETQKRIDSLSAELMSNLQDATGALPEDQVSQLMAQYTQEMGMLAAQLEAEQSQQRELTQARDLAWSTYTAVSRKAAETRLSAQASDMVRLASQASVPTLPQSSSRLKNTLITAVAALMLCAMAALGWEWWRGGLKA